jgi:hypothetical protein
LTGKATIDNPLWTCDRHEREVVYLSRHADRTNAVPDINEAERVSWIPLAEAQ